MNGSALKAYPEWHDVERARIVDCMGLSKIFSSGGGRGFKKKFLKNLTTFLFSVDQIDLSSSPKALKRPFRRQNFDKQPKKAACLGTFWLTFIEKNRAFHGAHSPLKINILAPQTSYIFDGKYLSSVTMEEKIIKDMQRYCATNILLKNDIIIVEISCPQNFKMFLAVKNLVKMILIKNSVFCLRT